MSNKILTLTHSSRKTDLNYCSLNYLTARYADPERLDKLPPFEKLAPVEEKQIYTGAVSFYRVSGNDLSLKAEPTGTVVATHKIQHASVMDHFHVLICYESFLELWKFHAPLNTLNHCDEMDFTVLRRYDHPHFAGLHTCFPSSDKLTAVLAASAPDAVLILDLDSGVVRKTLRMPENLYGKNYELTDEMDLRSHYIANDFQTTHINSAYPSRNGNELVLSTLIQGAIGIFDVVSNTYREIIRGFVGCHGARFDNEGNIYFADSVTGCLVFIDKQGKILRRFGIDSFWLHDAVQIERNIFAFSAADSNSLLIYNIDKNTLLFEHNFTTISDSLLKYMKVIKKYFPIPDRYKQFIANSTQFIDVFHINE